MLRSGAKMTGVSYRSGGESNTAVLSQAVHATLENIAILRTLIGEGKLRALAAQNKTRTPLLPDLPTMAEAGVPDCEANTFFGLAAPAGTRREHHQEAQRRHERGPGDAGDAEDHHRPRQRGQAEFAGGVRRLHRRPAQEVGRGRQGRRRQGATEQCDRID